jgi:hypothetical protein
MTYGVAKQIPKEEDFKEDTETVNKTAFFGVDRNRFRLHLFQDSSLIYLYIYIYHLFFIKERYELIQRKINLYSEQQINIRQEGPLKPKSVYAQWKEANAQEIHLIFAVIINALCKIS